MTASILFVRGGPDVQRDVFSRCGYGYWSAAFDAILDKHGIIDYDCRGFDVFDEPGALARYRMLLVAWQPATFWCERHAECLREFAGPVVLEGPLPPVLARALGCATPGEPHAAADLEVLDPQLHMALAGCALRVPFAGHFRLAPRRVETRPPLDSRWRPGADYADLPARIAARACSSYLLRLRRGRPFPSPIDNLLMLAVLLAHPRYRFHLEEADRALARAWITAARRDLPPAAAALAADLAQLCSEGHIARPVAAWRHLFVARRALAPYAAVRRLWFDSTLPLPSDTAPGPVTSPTGELAELLRRVVVLAARGARTEAGTLLAEVLRAAFDDARGTLRAGRFSAGAFVPGGACFDHPWLALACLAAHDVTRGAATPGYSAARCIAWQAHPCTIELAPQTAGEVLIAARAGERDGVLLARHGRVLIWHAQVLAAIAHFHSMPPLAEAFFDCAADDYLLLENAVVAALCAHARRTGSSFLRVRPWPNDCAYALCLRHDVDRIPSPAQFKALLDFECEARLGVSWYWLHDRVDAGQLARLREVEHEIGLHAQSIAGKAGEIAVLTRVAGTQVAGETWHGGAEFWRGHASVAAAVDAGLAYTEGVPSIMDFPHRFPVMLDDGTIACEELCCLTHNFSIDDGVTRKRPHVRDAVLLERRAEAGHCLIVLNHPDLNFEAMESLMKRFAGARAWCATAAEIARWWQSTHHRAVFKLTRVTDNEFELETTHPITGLGLELVSADRAVRAVDLAPAVPQRVAFD